MISVIVPVYNVEKYIEACIESIVCQSYKDYELIVIDDGSPDKSAGIAENILRETTVNYKIIHTENRGVSAARNLGIDNANGEFVVMIDADDVIKNDFLEIYAEMIRVYPESNIYSSSFSVVNEMSYSDFADDKGETYAYSDTESLSAFLERSVKFLLPTLLIKKDFLLQNNIRFDEAVRYSEDVQFIWRCLIYNREKVIHNSQEIYNYILHSNSTMTASGIKKILTGFEGIKRLYEETVERIRPERVKSMILPSTYFALLHGSAKMLSASSFFELYRLSGADKYIYELCLKGDAKTKLVSFAMILSKRLGYNVMRKF